MSDASAIELTVATGDHVRLNGFHGYRQALRTWCWAATAASISRYYRKILGYQTSIPQCYFVTLQHPGPSCRRHFDGNLFRRFDAIDPVDAVDRVDTIDCASNGCAIDDQPELGRARAALDNPGLKVFHNTFNHPISFMKIRQQIDRGYPIAIRLRNFNGTHHLLTIYGYNASVPSLIIWDPAIAVSVKIVVAWNS
jgi:hypothetical protein